MHHQRDSLFKRKEYLEKQLDLHSDNSLKLSEIFAELQAIEHKMKMTFNYKKNVENLS